jgi:formylmethanofuran dehydrogenase subunit A
VDLLDEVLHLDLAPHLRPESAPDPGLEPVAVQSEKLIERRTISILRSSDESFFAGQFHFESFHGTCISWRAPERLQEISKKLSQSSPIVLKRVRVLV